MKMHIPSIGDKIVLTAEWQFPCFQEHRNNNFIKFMRPEVNVPDRWNAWRDEGRQSVTITLPAGTVLRVDRIYIRKGKGEWDSVTFVVQTLPGRDLPKPRGFGGTARFWAKLEDVNEIEFEPCQAGEVAGKKGR